MKNKYAKLVDGVLKYAPYPLVIDGVTIWSNDEKVYNEHGYMLVVYAERPMKYGYFYTSTYVEQDGKLVQVWEANEIPTVMAELENANKEIEETPDAADDETTEIDGSEVSV